MGGGEGRVLCAGRAPREMGRGKRQKKKNEKNPAKRARARSRSQAGSVRHDPHGPPPLRAPHETRTRRRPIAMAPPPLQALQSHNSRVATMDLETAPPKQGGAGGQGVCQHACADNAKREHKNRGGERAGVLDAFCAGAVGGGWRIVPAPGEGAEI